LGGPRSGDPRSDGLLRQELVAGKAAVARPALRVEEAEGRPPVRRPVAVLRDADLRPLANDLPSEPDPAGPPQLETKPRAVEGGPDGRGGIARLQDEEERPGPSSERDEPGELVDEARRASATCGRSRGGRGRARGRSRGGRARPATREVQDEDIDRAGLEEAARHRDRLPGRIRDEDREPLEAHPAGNRLDRVETPGEVDPGDQRATGLGLRDGAQGQRRRAARSGTPERDGAGPREAAGRQQCVQLGEAGGDRPVHVPCRGLRGVPCRLSGEGPAHGQRLDAAGQWDEDGACRPSPGMAHGERGARPGERRARPGERPGHPGLRRQRGGRKRSEDLRRRPWRGRAPPGPEAGESGGAGGVAVHRTTNNRTGVRHWEGPCGPEAAHARVVRRPRAPRLARPCRIPAGPRPDRSPTPGR
jgi:hypothetical protein